MASRCAGWLEVRGGKDEGTEACPAPPEMGEHIRERERDKKETKKS